LHGLGVPGGQALAALRARPARWRCEGGGRRPGRPARARGPARRAAGLIVQARRDAVGEAGGDQEQGGRAWLGTGEGERAVCQLKGSARTRPQNRPRLLFASPTTARLTSWAAPATARGPTTQAKAPNRAARARAGRREGGVGEEVEERGMVGGRKKRKALRRCVRFPRGGFARGQEEGVLA